MHAHRSEKQAEPNTARSKQRGVVLPLFVAAMTAIFVMAGLALDMSHVLLNKSRLQNVVDAAALAGAKTLHETGDMGQARTAALDIFDDNAETDGNGEIEADVDTSANDVTVEFSAQLTPFSATETPPFVRVTVDEFSMSAWLIQLIGLEDNKTVSASAVSGPSPIMDTTVCDLAPFIICKYEEADDDDPFWGYGQGDVNVLKGASQTDTGIGGGNFYLAALDDETGGSTLADNAAGAYEGCATVGNDILTEPGNKRGPTSATNQRMGCNQPGNCGPGNIKGKYLPDLVTTEQNDELTSEDGTMKVYLRGDLLGDSAQDAADRGLGKGALDFNYENYVDRTRDGPHDNPDPTGASGRRNLTVIVADCSGKNSGRDSLPIEGFACYFMLQDIRKGGGTDELYGQFVDNCEGDGVISPEPGDGPGPTKIILYKDSDSIDS
jgi:Flp pilus assembly protein TadG